MARSNRVAPMLDDIDSLLHVPEVEQIVVLDQLAFELAMHDGHLFHSDTPSVITTQPPGSPRQAWGASSAASYVVDRQPRPTSQASSPLPMELENRVRGIFCLSREGCQIFREVLAIYPGCRAMLGSAAQAVMNLDTLENILGSFEGILASPFNYDGSLGQSSRLTAGGAGAFAGFGIQLTVSSMLSFIQSRRSVEEGETCFNHFIAQLPEIVTGTVSGFVTGVVGYVLENSPSLNLTARQSFMYSGFVGVITFFVFRILLRLFLNRFATERMKIGGTWENLFRKTALFNITEVLLTLTVVVVVSSLAVAAPIATVGTALKVASCEIAFHSLFTIILETGTSYCHSMYCCGADKGCYVEMGDCMSYIRRWTGMGRQATDYGYCAALLDCVTRLQRRSGHAPPDAI